MAYEIEFFGADDSDDGDGEEIFFLASNHGYSQLCEWVDSLPDEYPKVSELFGDGEAEDTALLSAQLADAIVKHVPSGDVKHTLDGFLKVLGVGDEGESAKILNGDD